MTLDQNWEIEDCTDRQSVIATLQKFLPLTEEDKDRIWRSIRKDWKGWCDNKCESMLGRHDCFLLEEILRNGGVIDKDRLDHDKKYHNYNLMEKSAKRLIQKKYIYRISMRNFHTIYIINPSLKVLSDE